jgi:histidinol-phosphate phosphatase family protein
VSGRWIQPTGRGPFAFEPSGRVVVSPGSKAAFVDRDGVLNEGRPDPETGLIESPLKVEEVRLLPGVTPALRRLVRAGYALVCASNQPAAAKGKVAVGEVLAVHERVVELLAEEGAILSSSRLCLHHPDGSVAELSGWCPCRKPAPGMLLDAAGALKLNLAECWMLGDTDADVLAGHAAGCQTVLVDYRGSAHKRRGAASPDVLAPDLASGVAQLLDHGPG